MVKFNLRKTLEIALRCIPSFI